MKKAVLWFAMGLYGVPFAMKYVYALRDKFRGE